MKIKEVTLRGFNYKNLVNLCSKAPHLLAYCPEPDKYDSIIITIYGESAFKIEMVYEMHRTEFQSDDCIYETEWSTYEPSIIPLSDKWQEVYDKACRYHKKRGEV